MEQSSLETLVRDVIYEAIQLFHQEPITHVAIDSRDILQGSMTLFVALEGSMADGHEYVLECYERGVRNFVIAQSDLLSSLPDCNVVVVKDTLRALQEIAYSYRSQFDLPCIAITGSNGKTIVKEWLAMSLARSKQVAKSPSSYNSQIGVALSMFEIDRSDDIGVFEAGISTIDEMAKLEHVIQPTIGIFTNIGSAHDAGFSSREEKIREKLLLFSNCEKLIVRSDYTQIIDIIKTQLSHIELITWGAEGSLFELKDVSTSTEHTIIEGVYQGQAFSIHTPYADYANLENMLYVFAALLVVDIPLPDCIEAVQELSPLDMRMQLVEGEYNCTIVNDTYSNDFNALEVALAYLRQHSGDRPTLAILSDMMEQGEDEVTLMKKVKNRSKHFNIDEVWWIGEQGKYSFDRQFASTEDLLDYIDDNRIADRAVLVKGARIFRMERVVQKLINRRHSTTMKVDLKAMDHNIQSYAQYLQAGTGIIAVIKAGAYGSGAVAIARLLQRRRIDYLAVAFADEGVALRKAGIDLPIMVLNPDHSSIELLVKYRLEPEVYDLYVFEQIAQEAMHHDDPIKIHLKLDSGMHRLGFTEKSLPQLLDLLPDAHIQVETVFSHLASSEDKHADGYTLKQVVTYERMVAQLNAVLGYPVKRHLVNTGGIVRFPDFHYEYVRLGLGMYGVDATGEHPHLEKVHTMEASIIQVKSVKAGVPIGYNQKGKLEQNGQVAIVNVGYADGLPRAAGLGKYSLYVNGQLAPIVGQVCMDLTIIDVSTLDDVQVGMKVEIFGRHQPIERLAEVCETIPYEILAGVSDRVRKIYVH